MFTKKNKRKSADQSSIHSGGSFNKLLGTSQKSKAVIHGSTLKTNLNDEPPLGKHSSHKSPFQRIDRISSLKTSGSTLATPRKPHLSIHSQIKSNREKRRIGRQVTQFDCRDCLQQKVCWPLVDVFNFVRNWNEDTLRLWLMSILLLSYMFIGCLIFSFMERSYELKIKQNIRQSLHDFMKKYPIVNASDLRYLLDLYGNATYNGFIGVRPRWDFYGSLYFTWTVVSTVGYGMTTPHTIYGKMFLMLYGLLGCASGILFFNLFLERVINLLANTLRWLHTRRKRRKSLYTLYARQNEELKVTRPMQLIPREDISRGEKSNTYHFELPTKDSGKSNIIMGKKGPLRKERMGGKGAIGLNATAYSSKKKEDDSAALDKWKPSVYWVLIILFLLTCFIGCTVSVLYSTMERWSYTDSLYFCFISFATIGFGDFVSNQKSWQDSILWYKVVNFIILAIGSCCTYSLLNVISIVIKQFLNFILIRFKRNCWKYCRCCGGTQLMQQAPPKETSLKNKGKKKRKKERLHDNQNVISNSTTTSKLTPNIFSLSNAILKWKKTGMQKPSLSGNIQLSDDIHLPISKLNRPKDINLQSQKDFKNLQVHPIPPQTPASELTIPSQYSTLDPELTSEMIRRMSDRSEYATRSPWRKDSGDLVSLHDLYAANGQPGLLEEVQRQLYETNMRIGFTNSLFLPTLVAQQNIDSPPTSASTKPGGLDKRYSTTVTSPTSKYSDSLDNSSLTPLIESVSPIQSIKDSKSFQKYPSHPLSKMPSTLSQNFRTLSRDNMAPIPLSERTPFKSKLANRKPLFPQESLEHYAPRTDQNQNFLEQPILGTSLTTVLEPSKISTNIPPKLTISITTTKPTATKTTVLITPSTFINGITTSTQKLSLPKPLHTNIIISMDALPSIELGTPDTTSNVLTKQSITTSPIGNNLTPISPMKSRLPSTIMEEPISYIDTPTTKHIHPTITSLKPEKVAISSSNITTAKQSIDKKQSTTGDKKLTFPTTKPTTTAAKQLIRDETEQESEEEEEDEDASDEFNSEAEQNSEASSDHQLGGEEVGPLAIMSKAFGEHA